MILPTLGCNTGPPHLIMKALEMEDEEVERFLDRQEEGPTSSSLPAPAGGASLGKWLGAALLAIGVVLFVTARAEQAADPDLAKPPPVDPFAPTSTTDDDATSTDTKQALLYSKLSTIIPDPDHEIDSATRENYTSIYGKWSFYDGDEDTRPSGDYCGQFPNRDIPGDAFPDDAWQVDAVYVNHFIDAAEKLLIRAKEAIFTEYGKGKPLPPEQLAERVKMFHWEYVDLATAEGPPLLFGGGREATRGIGGWTTSTAFEGLVRRLLHAMMTNDDFVVVLGGHSAAAGHGNHFHQSYLMQFHKIMAPVLARLGVRLVTRNLSQGGLGTIHNSLGFQSLYGDDIDIVLWDTAMTEVDNGSVDMFLRQALISGKKVPLLWGGNYHALRALGLHADADVGEFGNGQSGVEAVASLEHAQTLPFAARYLKCTNDARELCLEHDNRFCAHCWLPRKDIDPVKLFGHELNGEPGGQVRWHPGWREHQLVGRVLAFSVLDALQVAIQQWSDGTMGGPPLDDDYWHVTDYYRNIREKVINLDPSIGTCYDLEKLHLPGRICKTPMKGRSEHTPRFRPDKYSLTAIMKPAPSGDVPFNPYEVLYDGPDVHNPCYDIPQGSIDVLAVVTGRRRLEEDAVYRNLCDAKDYWTRNQSVEEQPLPSRRLADTAITPGEGWQLIEQKPGFCDGSYHAICGRAIDDSCPCLGHHDSRGMLIGNELSGWIVFDIPDVAQGIIIVRVVTWIPPKYNTMNENSKDENDAGRRLGAVSSNDTLATERERRLDGADDFPEDWKFDFAINGKITTWTKEEFLARRGRPQRIVEVVTLVDDPNFPKGSVEVAIRTRGCDRDVCAIAIPQIYWA